MSYNTLKHIFLFIFLVLLELLFISRITLGPYILPSMYIFFILQLPARINKSFLISLGFITGFIIDMLFNTGGVHAGASTLVAFLRIPLLPIFISVEDRENNVSPGIHTIPGAGFFLYTIILMLIHHLLVFIYEYFKLSAIPVILIKSILSALFSVLFVYIFSVLLYKKKRV
jgi:hypothetical protein